MFLNSLFNNIKVLDKKGCLNIEIKGLSQKVDLIKKGPTRRSDLR
jgi:hypothetical protein